MITKICNRPLLALAFASMSFSLVLTSCSDDFLQEKINYDKVGPEIYDDYDGADLRVRSVYGQCLPDPSSAASWKNSCTGLSGDAQSQSTEEYAGWSVFVNPTVELSAISGTVVPDYFTNEQEHLKNVWGRIRNINEAISGIAGGSLPQEQKDELLGQVYFFRAWVYYQLVKWYGGVPIITTVQNTEAASFTQRSSARACIQFILNDLDMAARLLSASTMKGQWASGRNFGRVTTGTALALKGRVLVLWASPMFNRANDASRWQSAYTQMKQELDSIRACGYELYQSGSNVNASDFASLFSQNACSEDVFVSLFNTIDGDLDQGKNNMWEAMIRPKNAQGPQGRTGYEASAKLVDIFPMADGRVPAFTASFASDKDTYTKLERSAISYDKAFPFYQRDPRFYRTFAFPGVRWAYQGDASNGGENLNPSDGANYALWNYVWFENADDQGNVESGSSYAADNLLGDKRGIYVRKRSDDLDVNASPNYRYDVQARNGGFAFSGAPYIEIRFAEVLLNFAEAACGAGHMDEAVEQLQKIRARVGYTASNNYGLQANLASDQATCMSAVLYERQIELAYEGKRFDDMRRWMLYDGGADQSANITDAPDTWNLTGWGGNTCTWLGFTPFNEQRRETMVFRVADQYGTGGNNYNDDPLVKAGVARCAPLDLRQPLDAQLDVLKDWYSQNLVRKDNRGDSRNSTMDYVNLHFYPKYYFLGFSIGAQNRNDSRLLQTIGWEDNNNGGANGTFDPLAD